MPGPIITKNPGPTAAVAVALMVVGGLLLFMSGILRPSAAETLFGLCLGSFGVYNWVKLARAEEKDRKKRRKKSNPTR